MFRVIIWDGFLSYFPPIQAKWFITNFIVIIFMFSFYFVNEPLHTLQHIWVWAVVFACRFWQLSFSYLRTTQGNQIEGFFTKFQNASDAVGGENLNWHSWRKKIKISEIMIILMIMLLIRFVSKAIWNM